MAKPVGERKVRGTARVAFIAHRDIIAAELEQGHTALAIYQRHQAKLGASISYQQFARYVRQLRDDGIVRPPLGRTAPRPSPPAKRPMPQLAAPTAKPQPAPPPAPEGSVVHARHEPAPLRTFNHDGVERPDDRRRLLGED